MKILFKSTLLMSASMFIFLNSCGKKKSSGGGQNGNGDNPNGQSSFTISGQLAISQGLSAFSTNASVTITHVMAVNPSSSNAQRTVAAVVDGKFSLKIQPGRPYVLVFIDSTKAGKAMVAAIFKARTLDSLAPLKTSGTADLGTVGIDTTSQQATASTSYGDLLNSLGLTENAASYLGAIDDLSLRYVNPDIDNNGIIDSLENKLFTIDFHIRSNTFKGTTGSTKLNVDDMTNQFFESSGINVADPRFNLSSPYALFDKSFDNSTYVNNFDPAPGVTFKYVDSTEHIVTVGGDITYSQLGFGNSIGFGPNYAVAKGQDNLTPGTELPGSSGTPVDYVFGFSGKSLTFTNVITLTKARLEGENTLLPFLKLNTTEGGVGSNGRTQNISSVSFKWMKRILNKTWTPATADEVNLVVNDGGGYVNFYVNAKSNALGFMIPAQAEGTVTWSADNLAEKTDAALSILAKGVTPNDICSMALSYDDKLGLRHFVGDAAPNDGVTPCY